ncbi:MAG: DUF4846 domain-containing protein [Myxococcota bacterium]|nr:DUF4846 domain-containing protein [Myxococcota bacterium]MEC8422329.1 DUF4846 domain-containing protein [Myxococcota bacterium]
MLPLAMMSVAGLAASIGEAYPPPDGAIRIPDDAFGAWLQALPMRPIGTPIRTHDGRIVRHPGRPVSLPLVHGDLQQCADSAIRLRAEFARASDNADSLVFHATSGDPIPWSRYVAGERPLAIDNRIVWRSTDPAGQTWDGWLSAVFMWAGTRSLAAYETTAAETPRAGDMLVQAGSPGHAVVLLDVARRGSETFVLVGEGYMPAQDFHVEHGPQQGWWPWTDNGVDLGHWRMPRESLRRWK